MKNKPVKSTRQTAKEAAAKPGAEINMLLEQQQFNDILETLPCYLILLSPDYHVVFANKFFRERFGESHGKRCFEYLFNRTEPCEVCETYKVLKKMKPLEWEWVGPDGHNYYIYDFPFKNTDGSTLIMEVGIDISIQKQALADLSKTRDELELRIQERTRELKEVNRLLRIKAVEHKQAEEREKRVAEEWQATFDSITDMVSIQDKECRLVRVNKAYANAVGMELEGLYGKKCYAVMHQTDCAIENCPQLETLKTCKSVTREIFEPRHGLYLEVTTSPVFNQAGELTGSVHIAKDITERKKVEQMKDEFIGLVSHELRTPLTVITGSLRTATSPGLSAEETHELLKNAIDGADQLAVILENMLELSRYQAGHLKLHLEPVSIAGAARDVIKKLKDQGATHEFLIDMPKDLPPIEADPTRVERILYNLLENATKYCPADTRITTSARTDGDFIVTSIKDQGPGISAGDQAKLFELFQQLETSRPIASGAGLGLVVCKRLVEAQGGWIKIYSALGKGSTFAFALPKIMTPS